MRKYIFAISFSVAILGSGEYVWAIDPSDGRTKVAEIDEVIVTARKRQERLLDIPVSVTAVSGDVMKQTGIKRLDQIAERDSGLHFVSYAAGLPVMNIRGHGNRAGNLTDSPVSIYIDSAYISRVPQMGHNPMDVERVEVMKGPQGAVFGRNTIAGAINVVTKDPTEEFEGYVGAGYGGSYISGDDSWNIETVVSGALSEKVLGRLAMSHDERDGYMHDDETGVRGGGYDADFARGKLLWKISENVEAKVTAEYYTDDRPAALMVRWDPDRVHLHNPFFPVDQLFFADRDGELWDLRSEYDMYGKVDSLLLMGEINWETSLGIITSQTTYTDSEYDHLQNADTQRFSILDFQIMDDAQIWSQEFRLTGASDKWSWMGGLYYFHEDSDPINIVGFGVDSLALPLLGLASQTTNSKNDIDSYAVFGQLGYDILPNLNFTVGVRWSRDEKDSTYSQATNGMLDFAVDRSDTWESLDPSASLTYHFTEDAMVYASYSTGYRSGGFNEGGSPEIAAIAFDPEEVEGYEIGLKGSFMDNRLRLKLAAFYAEYQDMQRQTAIPHPNTPGSFLFVIQNAGTGEVSGAEIEADFSLTENFRLFASYTYQDTELTDVDFNSASGEIDNNGAELAQAPENKYTLSLQYTNDIGPGSLNAGIDYVYTGSVVSEITNARDPGGDPGNGPIDGYSVINTRASYQVGLWNANFYVRNVTNEEEIAASTQGSADTFEFIIPIEPRTWGLQVTRYF